METIGGQLGTPACGPRVSSWRDRVVADGFLLVRGAGEAGHASIVDSLGTAVQTTAVVVRPESRALVTSPRALAPHTDHHGVDYIAWLCVQPADSGGDSIVVDGWDVLRAMRADDVAVLRTIRLFEHRVFDGDVEEWPMLLSEAGRDCLYYSYWLRQALDAAQQAAFDEFRRVVESGRFLRRLRIEAGDVLAIDNHRMLHGRTAIVTPSARHLRRVWIKCR